MCKLGFIKPFERIDKKARSIVAMLFWEWKEAQKFAGKHHFTTKVNEDAFKKAYKMLKESK